MPEEVDVATKAVLVRQMLVRALEAGLPARWVTADETYGKDFQFRTWLESIRMGFPRYTR